MEVCDHTGVCSVATLRTNERELDVCCPFGNGDVLGKLVRLLRSDVQRSVVDRGWIPLARCNLLLPARSLLMRCHLLCLHRSLLPASRRIEVTLHTHTAILMIAHSHTHR